MAQQEPTDRISYGEVKAALRRAIEDGGWQPGIKLPSERQLVERFSCARMTVRRALDELQMEGLVERRHGSGSYVADLHSISNLLKVRDIHEEILERGHRHSSRVLDAQSIRAGAAIGAAMELPVAAPVFSCRIIHFENGVPIQLEQRFINPSLIPDFLALDLKVKTPSSYLFERAPLTEAEQVIEAVNADSELAAMLRVPEGAALLLVSRRTLSRGRVASLARLYHPGTAYKLIGRFSA